VIIKGYSYKATSTVAKAASGARSARKEVEGRIFAGLWILLGRIRLSANRSLY
jgi:hypothetical protein